MLPSAASLLPAVLELQCKAGSLWVESGVPRVVFAMAQLTTLHQQKPGELHRRQ